MLGPLVLLLKMVLEIVACCHGCYFLFVPHFHFDVFIFFTGAIPESLGQHMNLRGMFELHNNQLAGNVLLWVVCVLTGYD